jgi:hypothetical protein
MPDKQQVLDALEKEIKRSQNKLKYMEKQLNISKDSTTTPDSKRPP